MQCIWFDVCLLVSKSSIFTIFEFWIYSYEQFMNKSIWILLDKWCLLWAFLLNALQPWAKQLPTNWDCWCELYHLYLCRNCSEIWLFNWETIWYLYWYKQRNFRRRCSVSPICTSVHQCVLFSSFLWVDKQLLGFSAI